MTDNPNCESFSDITYLEYGIIRVRFSGNTFDKPMLIKIFPSFWVWIMYEVKLSSYAFTESKRDTGTGFIFSLL